MVLAASSQAGHAGDQGDLEGLPDAVDMTRFGVEGDGYIDIDPIGDPPRLIWIRKRRVHSVWQSRFPQEEPELRGRPSAQLRADVSTDRSAIDSTLDAYSSRIAYLIDEATHDGYDLNKSSEVDFRQFVGQMPDMRKGDLVLMDNGNLRAIWKHETHGHLGLQFLGDNMVQYVIFRRRLQERDISRVAGRDSLDGIVRQINAFQLHSLLCK